MNNKLNNETMKAQEITNNEIQRRTNLVNSESFRRTCAKVAKQIGITRQEWNQNKAIICLMFANEICGIENEQN